MSISLTLTVNDMAEGDAAEFFARIAEVFAKARAAVSNFAPPAKPVEAAPVVEDTTNAFEMPAADPAPVAEEPKRRGRKPGSKTGVQAPVEPAAAKAPLVDDPIPDFGVAGGDLDEPLAAPSVTLDQVRDLGNEIIRKGGRDIVMAVLKEVGAVNYPSIKPDMLGVAFAKLQQSQRK